MLKMGKIYEIAIYGKVTSSPSGHVFQRNKILWRNLKDSPLTNISMKKNWNPTTGLGEEDFLRFGTWLPRQQGE